MQKRKYVLNIDKGDVIRSRSLQSVFVFGDRMSSYFSPCLFTSVRLDRIFQYAQTFAQSLPFPSKRKILSKGNDRIFSDAIKHCCQKN